MNNFKKVMIIKRANRTPQQIDDFIKTRFKNNLIGNVVIDDDSFSFTIYSKMSYEQLVNRLVAEKYTIQDELAIQRKYKKGVNEIEFNEYDAYVEECKVKAKQFIEEREKAVVE
jgi:ribosomal protein L31E